MSEGHPFQSESDRCSSCGVSKQQILQHHNARIEVLQGLIKRAAPFVNAVCIIAEDKTPSLAWLADAGIEVGTLGKGDDLA